MARATFARVKVRLLDDYPTGITEAIVTALCASADYRIDNYTKPNKMSTTDDTAIEIAVEVVLRMLRQGEMIRRSSGASAADGVVYPDIVILTDNIKAMIDRELNVSHYGIAVLDGMG